MTSILITGAVGLATTVISSVVTFLLSKKKYNTGVQHDSIENMQKALEFYEHAVESNNKTLTDLLEKSEQLANTNVKLLIEVQNLKVQVELLVAVIKTEIGSIDLSKYGISIGEDGVVTKSKSKKGNK